jgi:hypothetical protein
MDNTVSEPSDILLFEIPEFMELDEFHERIRPRWPGWTRNEEEISVVAAEVGDDPTALAELLREVESYVAEAELFAIRFWLDGRPYVLTAPVREPAAT